MIVDSLPYLPAVFNPAATVENRTAMAAQMRDLMNQGGAAYQKRSEAAIKKWSPGQRMLS